MEYKTKENKVRRVGCVGIVLGDEIDGGVRQGDGMRGMKGIQQLNRPTPCDHVVVFPLRKMMI